MLHIIKINYNFTHFGKAFKGSFLIRCTATKRYKHHQVLTKCFGLFCGLVSNSVVAAISELTSSVIKDSG